MLASFWGFAIWGEVPGAWSAISILLILGSGVFVALRAARLNVAPTAQVAAGRR